MVSREQKRESLHDKLQILRSITHSHSMNEASIVLDASNYIKDLKQKVEQLNGEIATAESSIHPRVTVETLEKGFLVSVNSANNRPGLLVSILSTLEELGLSVVEARVSCVDSFHLQALGGETMSYRNDGHVVPETTKDEISFINEEDEENIDAQTLKRAISNTIKNWSEGI